MTQLLSHINNILNNSINGDDTDCIYIDYSKAFDKVDHGALLRKLEHYKIPIKYMKWIDNFLKGRVETVFFKWTFFIPYKRSEWRPSGLSPGASSFYHLHK